MSETTDNTIKENTERRRKIVVSKEVKMIVNKGEPNEVTKSVYRNRVKIFNAINELSDTDKVTVIEVEDELLSEAPEAGEERKSLTIVDNQTKEEALKIIASQILPDAVAVSELFKLLDYLSVASSLSVAGFAVVFGEDTTGHFAFETPNSDIKDKTIEACINTLSNLVDAYTKESKEKRPLLNVGVNRIIV
jgi:hypothetical protein